MESQALHPEGDGGELLRHRILIVHPPQLSTQIDPRPHELSFAPSLEVSDEVIAKERPDIVACFAERGAKEMESHVLTWLVQGFKGKLILFDPQNSVSDHQSLVAGQVVDDYFAGPISL